MAANAERSRLEQLWARWLADGGLSPEEERELEAALVSDEGMRDDLLADQRIDGALSALGRSASEGNAFARRFAERVAAEKDGRQFVSSVRRQLVAEKRARRARWAWLLVPAAAVALLVALRPARRTHPPAPVAVSEREAAEPAPAARGGASPRPDAIARVERAQGTVQVIDGARHAPAAPGTPIASGRGLMTVGRDSSAVVAFSDGSSLSLDGESVLAQVADRAPTGGGKEAFLARGRLVGDIAVQPAGRPMLISTPQAEVTVLGTHFTLLADGRSTRVDVQRGAVRLAPVSGAQPAIVHAAEYALVSNGSRAAVQAQAKGAALLVVGHPALQFDDERVKHRLEGLGFEVRVRRAGPPDAESLRQAAVILVSSSVFSLDLNTQYRDVAIPVVVWEPSLFDDFGMTRPEENGGCGVGGSSGEVFIKTIGHPLAAGLDGPVAVVGVVGNGRSLRRLWMSYGVPGPAATVVATWSGIPDRAALFAYERGAAMPGLAAAPARRVGFFFYDDGRLHMTDAGWTLFDAAVAWAASASQE